MIIVGWTTNAEASKDDIIIIKFLVWSGEKVKILSNCGDTMSDFDEHLILNREQVNIS
jgi:hypothetical protein